MVSARVRAVIVSTILLATAIAARPAGAQPPAFDRDISQLTGNLYRVRVDRRHTVFLVTANGIVLVDPLSTETALWLQTELARRFPPGAVRYVVHTNHLVSRAEGASIFNATAELVGQRGFNGALSDVRRSEEPRYRRVRDIETHFDETRTITLGGRSVELVHAQRDGLPENAIVNFPSERTAFAADAPPVDESTFRFGAYSAQDAKRWLNAAVALNFDTMVIGDGRVVSKDRIAKVAAYVDRLFESVAAEYEAGRMVSQFDERALPQSYRSDASFTAWRANVSDVYRRLSVAAVDVTMGGLGHYIAKDETAYCAGYSTCSTGGMVGAATTSLGVSLGRWAVLGEFMISDNEYSSRVSRLYDEDVAMRETRGAVMIRHTRPAGAFSTRVLGGLSYAVADRRGMDRVKEALVPVAGRHPIASRESRFGFIGGIDLVVGRRVGIVFPLRFNYALEAASPTWPSRMDAQAGVALTLRLFRSID